MQLTHPSDDKLTGLFVGKATERRIFFRQTLQTRGHLFLVRLGLRLNRHADDGFGEGGRLEGHVERLFTERVACRDIAQTNQRGDVAGKDLIYILAFAALNDHQATHSFATTRPRVVDGVTLLQLSGINPEKDQFPSIGISPQFEGERTKLLVIVGRNRDLEVRAGLQPLRGGDFERTGKIIDDRVEQCLDTFLLKSRSTNHRDKFNLASESTNGRLENQRSDGLFRKHQFGDLVILVRYRVDQFGQSLLRFFFKVLRYFLDVVFQPLVDDLFRPPNHGLLINQVNYSRKMVFRTDGQIDWERIGTQFLAHIIQRIVKVGPGSVHLIDKGNAGNLVLRSLPPHRL